MCWEEKHVLGDYIADEIKKKSKIKKWRSLEDDRGLQ